jgi:hypothetical protein
MRGSCRYCRSGNRDSTGLDGGGELPVGTRMVGGGLRGRGHFVYVQKAYPCVVLSCPGVGLYLRSRSMVLDTREVSEES